MSTQDDLDKPIMQDFSKDLHRMIEEHSRLTPRELGELKLARQIAAKHGYTLQRRQDA